MQNNINHQFVKIMKNVILISTLLIAGTLAAFATTTLDYAKAGNFNSGNWYDDNAIALRSSRLEQHSGFYTFEASELDFSNLKSATFNIYLEIFFNTCNLKFWAVELENTDLDGEIAKKIIASVNQEAGFVSTSLTSAQSKSMLSIDITSVLQKITKGNDVAILIGMDGSAASCYLDYDKGATTLSVEFFAVPEPSMFGLVAGTLALALAGTRRRRRK